MITVAITFVVTFVITSGGEERISELLLAFYYGNALE